MVTSIAHVGIEGLCYSGGTVSSIACGFINQAADQINQAIRTGNNDWAECLGITRLGACIGEHIGKAGWTNNNGISQPKLAAVSYTHLTLPTIYSV